jgi:hypothetical protein
VGAGRINNKDAKTQRKRQEGKGILQKQTKETEETQRGMLATDGTDFTDKDEQKEEIKIRIMIKREGARISGVRDFLVFGERMIIMGTDGGSRSSNG